MHQHGQPISEVTIQEAIRRLSRAAPQATIILFGSCAAGTNREGSDVDFLVVEPEVTARRREMVRLSDVLRPLRIPADIVVIGRKSFEAWQDTQGTLVYEAVRKGRLVYGSL